MGLRDIASASVVVLVGVLHPLLSSKSGQKFDQ